MHASKPKLTTRLKRGRGLPEGSKFLSRGGGAEARAEEDEDDS